VPDEIRALASYGEREMSIQGGHEMSAYAADYAATNASPGRRAIYRAEIALLIGIAAGVPFALIGLLAKLTPNDHHFRHAADYWYTGLGIPYLVAPIVLLAALRSLHAGRDGRLGRAGFQLTAVALGTIVALLPYGVAAGTSGGTGPTYPIAAFAADVGMLLFCVGAFRARLLPRPLLAAWLVAWVLGGALGPAWGAPLLVAVYVAIAVVLPRSVTRSSQSGYHTALGIAADTSGICVTIRGS
jgi:hypothetical protein